jgi:MYXO-CTERM domain-containing protein
VRAAAAISLLGALVWPAQARAAEVELQNDGFVDNGQAACQDGFRVGDHGASSFTHDEPYTLTSVRFLFCGADTSEAITLHVYREEGTPEPGAELYVADFQVQGAEDAMSELDLSGEDIVFDAGEAFRVSIEVQHNGAPAIARDTDGDIQPGVNWIYDTLTGAWGDSQSFGLTGDWVIRARVETAGGGGAGGMPPTTTTTTTASSGAGGAGGGGGETDGGDCSCRAAGAGGSPRAALALVVVAAWIARRRRR